MCPRPASPTAPLHGDRCSTSQTQKEHAAHRQPQGHQEGASKEGRRKWRPRKAGQSGGKEEKHSCPTEASARLSRTSVSHLFLKPSCTVVIIPPILQIKVNVLVRVEGWW